MSTASSSSSAAAALSWRTHKERGKSHFSSGRYHEALASYRAALVVTPQSGGGGGGDGGPPDSERQVLLSNVVACRLKIVQESPPGVLSDAERTVMCESAVEEAKQCIALNDRWAKGHVRLASAYIAMGDHSNDACNSLQRALALDSGNAAARQMLLRELRRDREQNGGGGGASSAASAGGTGGGVSGSGVGGSVSSSIGSGGAEPSAPPFEGAPDAAAAAGGGGGSFASSAPPTAPPPADDYTGPNDYTGPPNAEGTNSNANAGAAFNGGGGGGDDALFAVDESPTLTERFQFRMARLSAWWEHELSDDMKTLLKVGLGLLVMYIALGGRFGLDSALGGGQNTNRGSYEPGESAYDRYYGRSTDQSNPSAGSAGYNDRTTGRYSNYDSASHTDGRRTTSSSSTYQDYTYNPRSTHHGGRSGRSGTSSYHMPNLFDGSVPSMLILAVIAYACHHFGINPFHALMMLNMVTGNRGHRGGMGMRNFGMMGMGYGMMRNAGMMGQRQRGGFRRGG